MIGNVRTFDAIMDFDALQTAYNLNSHKGSGPNILHSNKKNNWFLGFSRLAIQKLSNAENQLRQLEDGSLILFFNSEACDLSGIRKYQNELGYNSKFGFKVILAQLQIRKLNPLLEKQYGECAIVILNLPNTLLSN